MFTALKTTESGRRLRAAMGDGPAVSAFRIDDRSLFKESREREAVFDALREYYDGKSYRFEVPSDRVASVAECLSEHGSELIAVDDPERFCVVTGRCEPHADIPPDAVGSWTRRGHRFFRRRNPLAVVQAVQRGARPVAETAFEAGIRGAERPVPITGCDR